MTTPAVSVVMPVRDGAPWLSEACLSILGQSLANLELIVIDDGSSDASPDILSALAAADRRLRWQRQAPLGLVAALDHGLGLAEAPLLARLDADDVALPTRLALQSAFMAAHPDVVLLGSWAHRIDAGGRRLGRLDPPTAHHDLVRQLAARNPFVHSTVMMRTAAARRIGGYRAACDGAEDYDLWLRLSEQGSVAILGEPLVLYREHGDSVTRRRHVRQCFAARLARQAARERRDGGRDSLSGLAEPPDWWAADADDRNYAADARICRLLDLAAADAVDDAVATGRLQRTPLPPVAAIAAFSHAEKRLLRGAVANLLRIPDRPPHMSTPRLAGLLVASRMGRWLGQ